jgi:hypothetical protein
MSCRPTPPEGYTMKLTPNKLGNLVTLSNESIADAPVDELDAIGTRSPGRSPTSSTPPPSRLPLPHRSLLPGRDDY